MKKYVFDKSIYLGLLKKNFNAGQIIELDDNSFIINGEKISDMRDIKICLKKQYLVPFEGSRFDIVEGSNVKDEQVIEQKKQEKTNHFGFKVEKMDGQNNMIPLSKFTKPTQLDETKAFVEEDGFIKQETNQIKITPAVTKIEITDKTTVEEVQTPIADNVAEKKVTKTAKSTKTAKNVKAKAADKKTTKTAVKSKVDKNIQIKKQQVAGEIRGMTVLKGE